MDYEQLPKSALIPLLQERDAADSGAGKDGLVLICDRADRSVADIRLISDAAVKECLK